MKDALADLVTAKIDTHDAKNAGLVGRYRVDGIPAFFLLDAQGEVIDRWSGFAEAGGWRREFDSAHRDLAPAAAKERRFRQQPDAQDAIVLARIAREMGDLDTPLALLRRALDLPGAARAEIARRLFDVQRDRLDAGLSTLDDVRAAGDAAMRIAPSVDAERAAVGLALAELAASRRDPALFAPHAAAALDAAGRLPGAEGRVRLAELRLADALLVKNDKDAAFAAKRDTLPEGWRKDPVALNDFAWWCVELGAHLDEAAALAQDGVGLARDDRQKAMIFDTAAEIAAARGRRAEALAFAREAARLDPSLEHYRKQVEKFGSAT